MRGVETLGSLRSTYILCSTIGQSVSHTKQSKPVDNGSTETTYWRTLRDIGPRRGRANCRKVAGHGRPPRRDSERGKHRVCEDQGGALDEKRRHRNNPGQIRSTWSLTRLLFPRRWHESLWGPGVSRSASRLSPVGPKTLPGSGWPIGKIGREQVQRNGFPPRPTSAELSPIQKPMTRQNVGEAMHYRCPTLTRQGFFWGFQLSTLRHDHNLTQHLRSSASTCTYLLHLVPMHLLTV
jgi:hypothetical protein